MKQIKIKNRRVNPITFYYERLRAFREAWEANGGTRGTLRQARKQEKTLFPEVK